jgi:peptide deformylase
MIIRNASQVGNPVIRAKAKNADLSNQRQIKTVVKNLIDSMRHHDLVGMAAPQIGKSLRVFVTEIRMTRTRKEKLDDLRVFINPRTLSVSKKIEKGWEGCGSVACAQLFGKVERPHSVTVEAFNEKGEKFKLEASGLLARVIQHEMDHLNGALFIDTADTKTLMSRNEYIKMRKQKSKFYTEGVGRTK